MSDAAASSPPRGGAQRIPRPERWAPGRPPWWASRPPRSVPLASVVRAFEPFGPDRPASRPRPVEAHDRLPSDDPRSAAVLCTLWEEDGQAVVLLTRRSSTLRSHTGEVSFPGGRIEPGESPVDAALREAEEEVGLDPAAVEVIGQLPPMATVSSDSIITSYVAVLASRPALRPNPAEVERAFAAPIVDLVADGTFHEERWSWPGGGDRPLYFFDLPGDTVWGATARLLVDLLAVLRPVLAGPGG